MKESNQAPLPFRRGVIIASVLLVGTVAMASGHRYWTNGHGSHGNAPPPPRPTISKSGAVTVKTLVDRSKVMVGGDGTVRVQLTLEGEKRPRTKATTPTDLFVVLDRSGSMAGESITRAKAAALELIDQLSQDDRFSLVTYESGVRLEVPLGKASEVNRARWREAVKRLEVAGGTNMSSGLDLAHQHLKSQLDPTRATRMLLLSDGQANEGDSSLSGLTQRASRAAESGYVLSTVGIGLGFNEELMTALANVGTGNFYFIEPNAALAGVFRDEFESARDTVASALAVHLETPEGIAVEDAAGYVLERQGKTVTFRPGSLFAGQKRTVWVRYRVPTSGDGEVALGLIRAEFADRGERFTVASELPAIARVQTEEDFYAGIDRGVWGEGVAEDEFNALRMKVSSAIQRGDRVGAQREITKYRRRSQALNKKLDVPAVSQRLEEASVLAGELDDAFDGPNAPAVQNSMSKSLRAKGFDGRRGGAKKSKNGATP